MKRDLDLARCLLMTLETCDDYSVSRIAIDGYTEEQVDYHIILLVDAGLIEASSGQIGTMGIWRSHRLTWQGHDFLDAARDRERWLSAKAIVEKAGGVTFAVLQAVLVDLISKKIGLK